MKKKEEAEIIWDKLKYVKSEDLTFEESMEQLKKMAAKMNNSFIAMGKSFDRTDSTLKKMKKDLKELEEENEKK